MVMMRLSLVPVVVALAVSTAASQEPLPTNEALIARAKSFELDTPYVPPPGDPLSHYTSGFAKIMCSAVFITGLNPEFAAENIGYFTSPSAERAKVGKPVIDRKAKAVHIGDIIQSSVRLSISPDGSMLLCTTLERGAVRKVWTLSSSD